MRNLILAAIIPAALLVMLAPLGAVAEIRTETVGYAHGGKALKGTMVHDDSRQGLRPCVLIAAYGGGTGPQAVDAAQRLAGQGYAAFILDMLGESPGGAEGLDNERRSLASDRVLMRRRAAAGVKALLEHPLADQSRVAVLGFGFGGTVALELARSGAPLAGAVALEADLRPLPPGKAELVRCPVLVIVAAESAARSPQAETDFASAMTGAGADWQMLLLGGARQGFADPGSGTSPDAESVYNEKCAARAWSMITRFMAETLK